MDLTCAQAGPTFFPPQSLAPPPASQESKNPMVQKPLEDLTPLPPLSLSPLCLSLFPTSFWAESPLDSGNVPHHSHVRCSPTLQDAVVSLGLTLDFLPVLSETEEFRQTQIDAYRFLRIFRVILQVGDVTRQVRFRDLFTDLLEFPFDLELLETNCWEKKDDPCWELAGTARVFVSTSEDTLREVQRSLLGMIRFSRNKK